MSWVEPAAQGYRDVGQPAHDGGSILQEPLRVLLHQRPRGTFLGVGGLGWPGCVAVVLNQPSVPPESLVVRSPRTDSSATVPLPPDSSSTLSAGASRQLLYTVSWLIVTLLLPILFAAPGFVGERGGE